MRAVLTAHLSGGANTAPPSLWLDFGEEGEGEKGGKGKGEGGEERERRKIKREGEEERRERKERREGEGRNFVQL